MKIINLNTVPRFDPCSGQPKFAEKISHVGGFLFMVIWNPWVSYIKDLIVFCLDYDFVFKSISAPCDQQMVAIPELKLFVFSRKFGQISCLKVQSRENETLSLLLTVEKQSSWANLAWRLLAFAVDNRQPLSESTVFWVNMIMYISKWIWRVLREIAHAANHIVGASRFNF